MHASTRNTICVETGEIISHDSFAGDQHVLRLRSPQVAADSKPGNFVHLRCDPALPMRRPMSIMRADPGAGWIDILYKARGPGTRLLSRRRPGDELSLVGPIGVPFKLSGYRRRPLLIGGGVGIPPMIFLAEHLRKQKNRLAPLVMMGSELPFPFPARPSRTLVAGVPDGTIATMPLMEDWGIPCRLSSRQGFPGCFEGQVTELAQHWLPQQADTAEQLKKLLAGDIPLGALCDILCFSLSVELETKQHLLELLDVPERIRILMDYLESHEPPQAQADSERTFPPEFSPN